MKKLVPTEFTPWLLSVVFGIWILLISGVAGFYVPSVPPEASPPAARAVPREIIPATPTSGPKSPAPAQVPAQSPAQVATPPAPAVEPQPRTPAPAPSPSPTPTPAQRTHTVERGETLSEIAERYGISLQTLLKTNGITDPDKVSEGDKLTIPPSQ